MTTEYAAAVSCTVDGTAFARACHNALAHMPARGPYPIARLSLTAHGLAVLGTDGYTLGRAECAYDIPPADLRDGLSVGVPRDGLSTLDTLGRAARGLVDVVVDPRAVELTSRGAAEAAGMVMTEPISLAVAGLWEACDDLLRGWVTGRPAVPELVALDPALWGRFAKVKVPTGKSAMADLLISGPDDPILIKIGPGFLGAIMPVDREVAGAAASRGQEFLW